MKYYDIAEGKELTQEEFFDDETPEEIEANIELKIHLVIQDLRAGASYKEIRDTILDNELYFDKNFYNYLNINKNDSIETLKKLIYKTNKNRKYKCRKWLKQAVSGKGVKIDTLQKD